MKIALNKRVKGLLKYLLLFIMAVVFFGTTDSNLSTVNERLYTDSVSEISSCYSDHLTAYSDACITQQVPSANVARQQLQSKRVNNSYKRGFEFISCKIATVDAINYNSENSLKKTLILYQALTKAD